MARRRRPQGPSVLIPMLVAIVFWLGTSAYAYKLYEDVFDETKGMVVKTAAAELDLMRHSVQLDMNWVELELYSDYIGFRGDARYSNPDAIRRLCGTFRADVLPGRGEADDDTPGVEIMRVGASPGDIAGRKEGTLTAQETIALQDIWVNRLIAANSSLHVAIVTEIELRNTALENETRTIAASIAARNGEIDTANANHGAARRRWADNEALVDETLVEVANTYNRLFRRFDGSETAITELLKDLRSLRYDLADELDRREEELVRVLDTQNFYNNLINSRDEYDGEIYAVDTKNRWAYINIGMGDNVKEGMTFECRRYRGDTSTPQRVALLSVKQVMSARTAWCDILQVYDVGDFPKQGDFVANPGYEAARYSRFAFIGKFGGKYTGYSRVHATAMIRDAGGTVDERITPYTQVIVLGAEFYNDAQYDGIFISKDDDELARYSNIYVLMRPEDLYYMFGHDYR